MPANNPLRPAYVQRDPSYLPTSSRPLELFQDHNSILSLHSGHRHSATSTTTLPQPPPLICEMCSPPPSPHLSQAQRPPSLSAPVPVGHRKLLEEDRGTWTPWWLSLLNNPCVHLDGFPCTPTGCPNPSACSRESPSPFPSWRLPSPLTS